MSMYEVRLLEESEKKRVRKLWEDIFTEDSPSFLDYYFNYKCTENKIYAVEENGNPVSMLHCNPYCIQTGERKVTADYIVGVATDENYRHRGLMRRLLEVSLNDMADEKRPFTFLMPAAEAIYRPFGFRFIYNQPVFVAGRTLRDCSGRSRYRVRELCENEYGIAADNINNRLAGMYDVFTVKSEDYFNDIKLMYKSDGGNLMCLESDDGTEAYFSYWIYNREAEITELINFAGQTDEAAEAVCDFIFENSRVDRIITRGYRAANAGLMGRIMARVTNVKEMLNLIRAKNSLSILLYVEDNLVSANNGIFLWKTGPIEAMTEKISEDVFFNGNELLEQDCKADICLKTGVEDLAEWIFNGVVPSEEPVLKQIYTLDKVFINEIV